MKPCDKAENHKLVHQASMYIMAAMMGKFAYTDYNDKPAVERVAELARLAVDSAETLVNEMWGNPDDDE